MASRKLIGREEELKELAGIVELVRAGGLGVVLVEGEAGIGKTSLVRTALERAGAHVLWAGGDEAELGLDHGVIDQLLRNAGLDEPTRDGFSTAIGGDPLRTGAALVQLVDHIGLDRERIVAVVVDDAQWADHASLQALAFAARRLRRTPVLVCVVVRSGGRAHLPPGLSRLVDDIGRRVEVGSLGRAAVGRLATELSGEAVPPNLAERLLVHTRGNPLHLRSLLDEVALSALAGATELPSPRPIAGLVAAKLAGMSPTAQALVEAVAVLGDPITLTVAASVAEVDAPALAVDESVAHGLLEIEELLGTGGRALRVAHPLVRAAVLEGLALERRAQLHRRVGSVLGGTAGLRHRLLGSVGGDSELWREAVGEARRQGSRGAHGIAAGLFTLATDVATDASAREVSAQGAMEEHLLAGQVREASALHPVVDASGPSPLRSYVLGRAAYVMGPRRDAPPLLADAWRRITGSDDPTVTNALASTERDLAGRAAAMLATVNVDRARGLDAIRWARAALEASPVQAALASAAHMLASGHALEGTFDAGLSELDLLCRRVRGAPGRGGPAAVDAHSARGLLRLWTHRLEDAAIDFETSLAASTGSEGFVARETARFYLAETRYRQGRWDDAIALAQLSASLVDDSQQDWAAALPHATAARPLAARGQPADEHLERATAAAASVGAGVGIVLASVAALEVAACRRDHDLVVELGSGLAEDPRLHADERIAPWRASYVEALVATERLAAAAQCSAGLSDGASTPLVETDAARAAVVLAAAVGQVDDVDRAAEAGLALAPDLVGPYPRARLELAVGRAWRRRGERRRAMGVLGAALERFEALAAGPWVEQVKREMTASGLRPRRRSTPGGTDLTPQEYAVAQLVAGGRTNREAAAELVVSTKTVEHHLSRVYAKLAVRSRTELARRLETSI